MVCCRIGTAAIFFGWMYVLLSIASGLEQGDMCQTPNGTAGICYRAKHCPDLFKTYNLKRRRGVIPMPLLPYLCGTYDQEPMYCCTVEVGPQTKAEVITDVSKHPNIGLLRQDICGPVSQDRIINGNKTSLFELPWMALLMKKERDREEINCDGTIINNRYVLTAAHCIDDLVPNFVRLGEHDLKTDIDCERHFNGLKRKKLCAPPPQDIHVEKIIIHPNYEEESVNNDIALLRLSKPANFKSDAVKPICLPVGLAQQKLDLTGKKVDVSGWGLTEKGKLSDQLLKVTVRVVESSKCDYLSPLSSVTQICAGGDKNRGDSCEGDSGGPLTYFGEVKGSVRTIQYGIVSFGDEDCGTPGHPAAYTHVGYYMKWILDNMKP